jgi:hypothetical protein
MHTGASTSGRRGPTLAAELDCQGSLKAVIGSVSIVHVPQHVRKLAEIVGDDGVSRPVGRRVDGERTLAAEPRLTECARVLKYAAQVAEIGRHRGMPGSVARLVDGRRPLKTPSGAGGVSHVPENSAEELEVDRHLGMDRTVRRFVNGQGSVDERPPVVARSEVV